MTSIVKQLFLGASVAAGLSAAAFVAPAAAEPSFSTSGPDVVNFCSDSINTFADGEMNMSCTDSLGTILSGNSVAPGGNVELYNGTDNLGLSDPAWNQRATLEADFDGHVVTFSSLTFDDWFEPDTDGNNLANKWFADLLDSDQGDDVRARGMGQSDEQLFNAFLGMGGFQRLSDPNISYVNKADNKLTFGLAGHQDAGAINPLLTGLVASEVVKVTHDGITEFFYSFNPPTDSGQVNKTDGFSHNGNFEFTIALEKEVSTPEPASVLGLLAVGGAVVASRRQRSNKA